MNAITDAPISTPALGEFRTSPGIGALTEALSKAAQEFTPIGKTKTVEVRTDAGSKYTFSYAPLEDILAATQPALHKHGLVTPQVISQTRTGLLLITRLQHTSGEFMESVLPIPNPGKPQLLGSALTYMRRYAYSALLCVSPDDDDDGNAAQGHHIERSEHSPPHRRTPSTPPPEPSEDVPSLWVIASTKGGEETFPNGAEWLRQWGIRFSAIERANAPAADRAARLRDVFSLNAAPIQRLEDAGYTEEAAQIRKGYSNSLARLTSAMERTAT